MATSNPNPNPNRNPNPNPNPDPNPNLYPDPNPNLYPNPNPQPQPQPSPQPGAPRPVFKLVPHEDDLIKLSAKLKAKQRAILFGGQSSMNLRVDVISFA